MRRAAVLLPVLALFALRLAAQSYYANIDGANCSVLWGWAWDGARPNTAISIDLYDGAVPVATILAGDYRSDLYSAGYGNGYHGFTFTIPPSLKDGLTHTIVHYVTGTHTNISGASGSINCAAGSTGYVYYDTDPLTSVGSSWTQNGSVSAGSGGLTATSTNGGSLISSLAVYGASTTDYEVKTTLTLTASGGTYVSYLRASTNAMTGPAATGTFYSLEVTPTISGGYCSAAVVINKSISGSITQLFSETQACHNGITYRVFVRGSLIGVTQDNWFHAVISDSSIASGKPGVGALGTPSGNSVASVSLGPTDAVAPQAPSAATIATSVLPTRMDVRFAGSTDDATGVADYFLYRDGSFFAASQIPEFSDETLSSGTHTYTLYSLDFHDNISTGTNFTITTPPSGSVDTRRVGLRPTGAYWGASPEQIDLLSGNMNFTVPLLSAQMRGGGSIPINLSYNSQNWRKDAGGTWNLGTDVGYGYGWRLSAGSLVPFYYSTWALDHFLFTDASGAEYRLDQNSGGIWSSKDSLYVWYDASNSILHFRDGSYWIMGCTSAGSEPDTGTMYPTTIENANGNQIIIHYNAGNELPFVNSSARISYIDDVRAQTLGGLRQTYVFVYSINVVPHLTSVQNTIGTSEGYLFSFGTPSTLVDPFSSGYSSAGGLTPLANFTASGIGMEHSFSYDSSGEMTQATFPYAGYFRYNYGSVTYSSGFTQSEVTSRVMSKDGTTGSEVTYPFTHESSTSSYPIHQFTTMADPGGVGQKYWAFSQSGASIGLVTTYKGQQYPGPTTLTENDFTWSQDANSNFYIGSTLTTWTYTPGGPYQTQSKVNQTVDVYGNVTQVQKFQFGSLSTPARTYNYSYLNSSSYTSQYIYNRLSTATVTDGTTTTYLASNGYDSNYRSVTNPSTTPYEWDTGYSSATYRGNLTSSSTPSGSASYAYDNAGNIGYATVNGVETASVTSTTTNFAAPDQLTVGSLSTSMSWNAFLGPTSDTGPNGDSISESYDTYARPTQVTSPFGATTSYVYNSPPFSSSSPATVTIYPNGTSGRWTKNTLDGFGRTIKTEAGDSSSTYSSSEMVYAPCACSPIGKLYQQSMAHAPGASSPTWTTYTYDGIGRTLTAATVGSDTQGTTSYYYYNYTSTDLYTVVEDAAGNYKLYLTDVFNNLAEVYEPATSSEPSGAYTYYGYDLLDHLTGVYMSRTAGLQTRSFTYSGNNLTSATNPENGTVTYTYNSYNKVATKTDAKGQAIVYTYDTLARLTEVQKYPSGTGSAEDTCQRENYYYDTTYISGYSNYPSGRLTAVQYYGGSSTYGSFGSPGSCDTQFVEAYNYSQPGGKVGKRLQITRNNIAWSSHSPSTGSATANLDSTYTYDNEGRMITEQYPVSGPYLGWAVDSMGRWNTMTDLGLSSSIITGATYGPSNELLSTSGNLGESRTYNSMLQLTQLYVGVIGGTTMGITYGYPSSNNNGKISSQTDNNSGEVVQYTYDALNRLASATATSSAWGQSYSYDGFGNLTGQTVTVGSAPSYSASPNASTNAVGSADANGNYIGYIPGTYLYPAYDVMNRMVSIGYGNTIAYSYAPGNKRVWRGLWTSGSLTTDELTFWSVSGQKLGTYSITVNTGSGSTAPSFTLTQTATNFYFGRKLIKNGNGSSYYWSGNYLQADRLGSIGKYYPYGQEKPSATTNGTEKFTGYFRDAETGLDYADQRYHNPGTGTFLTPDPYRATSTGAANPGNPGSWNKYAYVLGDPVNYTDRKGMEVDCTDDCDESDDDDPCVENYMQIGCDPTPYQPSRGTGGGTGSGFPQLTKGKLKTYNNARSLAERIVQQGGSKCDGALSSLGIPSLESLLTNAAMNPGGGSGANTGGNVYDGTTSQFPQNVATGQTTAQWFAANSTSVGAEVIMPNGAGAANAGSNVLFLGPAFFDPSLAGVSGVNSALAQAFMLLHEAVHLVGGVTDSQAGGSKQLTTTLENDCFPILAATGALGNLVLQ